MKKHLPHIITIAAFLLLTVIYFSPLFGGKELKQGDIDNWKGMAQEIVEFKEKTGEQTLWTNSMFGGMPAYQISAVYTANLVQYIDKVVTLWLPSPANYVFLFMAGFYFLLITMRVDQKLAIVGAVAFAFSSYFLIIIDAGHNSKAHAIGYMAPVVAGMILAFRGRMMIGMAIFALALALELYANHLQITYYLMMTAVIFVLTEFYSAVKEKRLAGFVKAGSLLCVAAMLALASNITNILATQEYAKYSTRGPSELSADKDNQTTGLDRDYITDWSYGIGESLTLLVPDFKGGASEPIGQNNKDALKEVDSNFRQYVSGFGAYFGDQPFTNGPYYVGAIIIFLFIIGLFIIKGPVKWWLLGATVLSLLLSWGRHFMSFTNFFLDNVPGYDKFRAVAMILVIAQFAIPVLAMLAVNKMISEKDFFVQNKKRLYYISGAVMLVTFLIAISPGTFTNLYTEREYDQVLQSVQGQPNSQQLVDNFFTSVSNAREHIVKTDAIRSLMFILVSALLIWSYLRFRYKKEYFIFGLLALVMLDLMVVDRRYLSSDDFVKKSVNAVPFQLTQADQLVKQDTSSYRVLNLTKNIFNDASVSYYHQSIGGYHGAKLKRYKELIDYSLTPEIAAVSSVLQKPDSSRPNFAFMQPAINMLNTKYIIYNPDAPPLVNSGALGNAWFVSETKFVPNSDAEIAEVRNFDPAKTAIIDERYKDLLSGFNFRPDANSRITLLQYKPNHLIYESQSSSEQLAVFSEIFYDKGWHATIDGNKADYFRVNYVLRGMKVPAGNHKIEFKFAPEVVSTGEKISLAGSALILILIVVTAVMEWRRKKDDVA